MQTIRAIRGPNNRTLNRLIKILALGLLVGVPLIAGFYWMDRHVDASPSQADRAIATAEANVRQSPDDLNARNNLAAAYVTAGRFQDGIDQFTQILQKDAANRAAILGRGLAYFYAGQPDRAKADFQAFVDKNSAGEFAKTDPQLEQAYYELGVIAIQESRPADAVVALQKALAIDGGDADALYSYGAALIRTGDPTKGVAALRQAVAFVPSGWCDPYGSLVDGYTALHDQAAIAWATGMVDFCGDRLDQAEAALKPLVGGSMRTDALIGLALVAARRGDADSAAALLQASPGDRSEQRVGIDRPRPAGPDRRDLRPAPASSPAGGS